MYVCLLSTYIICLGHIGLFSVRATRLKAALAGEATVTRAARVLRRAECSAVHSVTFFAISVPPECSRETLGVLKSSHHVEYYLISRFSRKFPVLELFKLKER